MDRSCRIGPKSLELLLIDFPPSALMALATAGAEWHARWLYQVVKNNQAAVSKRVVRALETLAVNVVADTEEFLEEQGNG
jgi:hypothetical protein